MLLTCERVRNSIRALRISSFAHDPSFHADRRDSNVIAGTTTVKVALTLILVLAAQTCATGVPGHSQDIVGRWKVEITFKDGTERVLRFDAQPSGKGSLLVRETRSNMVEPAKPAAATWEQNEKGVTFSGPVEFAVGNFGREQGTMVFKGKFETSDVLSGVLAFFPMDQNPKDPKATPSKTGTFRSTRVSADDAQ